MQPALIDLTYLREFSGNDEEFVAEIAGIFLYSCQHELPQIEEAFEASDFDALYRVVHKLKPNIAFMGISSIGNQVIECEILAKEDTNSPKIKGLIAEICRVCREAAEELIDLGYKPMEA